MLTSLVLLPPQPSTLPAIERASEQEFYGGMFLDLFMQLNRE